ncbi:MAG TPA: circadian clock KaiB family protein [Methanomicrobiales archaeon]|nr:circadian clock KaiB family protein [Methanomicrobiales archaeon]
MPDISGYGMAAGTEAEENRNVRLRLYVSNRTPNSLSAFANAKKIFGDRLRGRYFLEVIDIRENPGAAIEEGVIATPLLVRLFSDPERKRRKSSGRSPTQRRFSWGWGCKVKTMKTQQGGRYDR